MSTPHLSRQLSAAKTRDKAFRKSHGSAKVAIMSLLTHPNAPWSPEARWLAMVVADAGWEGWWSLDKLATPFGRSKKSAQRYAAEISTHPGGEGKRFDIFTRDARLTPGGRSSDVWRTSPERLRELKALLDGMDAGRTKSARRILQALRAMKYDKKSLSKLSTLSATRRSQGDDTVPMARGSHGDNTVLSGRGNTVLAGQDNTVTGDGTARSHEPVNGNPASLNPAIPNPTDTDEGRLVRLASVPEQHGTLRSSEARQLQQSRQDQTGNGSGSDGQEPRPLRQVPPSVVEAVVNLINGDPRQHGTITASAAGNMIRKLVPLDEWLMVPEVLERTLGTLNYPSVPLTFDSFLDRWWELREAVGLIGDSTGIPESGAAALVRARSTSTPLQGWPLDAPGGFRRRVREPDDE